MIHLTLKEFLRALISPFFLLGVIWEIWILVIFSVGTDYEEGFDPEKETIDERVDRFYTYQSDVAVMIFVGFGFLMTFLKRYGYSAVGYNFFLSAQVLQWAVLCNGFFRMVEHDDYSYIRLDLPLMVDSLFTAASVMITFGAVLGRTTPLQLFIIGIFETMFYSINAWLVYFKLRALDIGGSMVIHLFGAYFGLAVSMVHSKKDTIEHPLAVADRAGDLFAMVGTLWLWLLWPSFNAALAPPGSQFRVVINTVLSLTASCFCTFIFSYLFRGRKFDMVDVQNATLAGGVAVGCSADLIIKPGGAIGIGIAAGTVSTFGFNILSPLLLKFIGLQDTCGVHNLHGIPGIIGALAGIISPAIARDWTHGIYGYEYNELFVHGKYQAAFQTAAFFTSWGFALISGTLTGLLLRLITPYPEKPFDDSEFWHGVHEDDKYIIEQKTVKSDLPENA